MKTYKKQTMRRLRPLYLMALPGLLYILLNNYLPMAGLMVAFKDFNFMDGIFNSPWNGVENFKYLFSTSASWVITRNTILYNIAFIVINTVFGVGTAVLLNEIRRRTSIKVFQMAIMLPYLLSIIIVSYLAYAFLNTDTGFFNTQLFPALGLDPVSWYSDPKHWPWILLFINTLKNFGFLGLIYYATILSISKDYYEAAALDGANKWQQVRYVTLPFLKSTVIMMVFLAIGRMFYSDFGLFYHVPMDSGALYNVTNTLDTYVYRALVQLGDVGMAAAAGLYQSVVGFVLILTVNFIVRKVNPEDALF